MCTYKHLACLHVLWTASDICFLYASALALTEMFYIIVKLIIIIDSLSLNDFKFKVMNILTPKCNTFLCRASGSRFLLHHFPVGCFSLCTFLIYSHFSQNHCKIDFSFSRLSDYPSKIKLYRSYSSSVCSSKFVFACCLVINSNHIHLQSHGYF